MRRRFLHLSRGVSLPLLVVLGACTTTRAEPGETHVPSKAASLPIPVAPSAASSATPPPVAATISPPPPVDAAPPALSRCDALVGYFDGAHLTIHVPRPLERLAGTTLTLCRNGSCASATVPAPSDGRGGDGSFVPGFSVMPDAAGGSPIYRVTISGEPAAMTNGDRYSFTLKAADGSVVATASRAVTYDESHPNGPECDAYACKNATIELE